MSYKHLKGGVEFIDVIPKNPSGKIVSSMLAYSSEPPLISVVSASSSVKRAGQEVESIGHEKIPGNAVDTAYKLFMDRIG